MSKSPFDPTIHLSQREINGHRAHMLEHGCAPALSQVAISNLYTMHIASKKNSRQAVPSAYYPNTKGSRELSASLILEEALETIQALGFGVMPHNKKGIQNIKDCRLFTLSDTGTLDDMIDGCCDTIYVAVRALCALGAPDLPHLAEVCRANNAKFPGGEAIIDPNTGKYLKPPSWTPPNHEQVRKDFGIPALDHLAEFLARKEEK